MVVTMLGLIVLYPMKKLFISILLLLIIKSYGQNIVSHRYDQNTLTTFKIDLCKESFFTNQPLGRLLMDYTVDNSKILMENAGKLEEYDVSLNTKIIIADTFPSYTDISVSELGRVFYISKPNKNYQLNEYKLATKSSNVIFIFPDSINYVNTTRYKGKLLMVDFVNHVMLIDPDNPSSFQILFTLPDQFLGRVFSIAYIEVCESSDIFLFPQLTSEVYKLDFINKTLIKVCDSDFTGNTAVASPHPYLSCLDLDKNNSTTNQPKDYRATLCASGSMSICDSDIKVKTRPGFADSMRVWISSGIKDIGNEQLTLVGALPAGVSQKTKNGEWWFYFPKDYAEANIENLIKQIRYTNSKATPTLGERQITFYLYTAKVVSDPAVAHIFISKPQQTKQDYSACTGKTLTINGINIKKDTAFCTALKGKEGCDSTHCVTVTFSAKQSGTAKQNVCFGETYIFSYYSEG